MSDILIPGSMIVLAFLAGWKCCVAWHSCRSSPTPLQRAQYIGERKQDMREHRARISALYNQVFLSGINVGKSLT